MTNDLKVSNRSLTILQVSWSVEQNPYAHKPRKLPVMLSQDEVHRLIEAVPQMASFMGLLIADAVGVQITETTPKAEPIDAPRLPCSELLGATIQI